MLGLGILFHGSFKNFTSAVLESIADISGILIQFPLYFGIMGIMSSSGMVTQISDFFVSFSTETTLPIVTFFSAGLVNVFAMENFIGPVGLNLLCQILEINGANVII